MRKKKAAEHANHERWLVSYADFITLLFAFFVVMFATAQQDKSKAKIVAEAVRDAMEHGELSNVWTNLTKPKKQSDRKADSPKPPAGSDPAVAAEKKDPPKKPAMATQSDLAKSMEALNKGLAAELKSGKVTVNLNQRGLIVSLREAAFFASGDDTVSATSFPIIEKIAQVITPLANPLRLEGHTDSVPIHNSHFRNNWELSTARSIAMLELLEQRYQYPSERLSVAGYAENAPVDSNDTEEGRAHNRRVDLVVLSAEALAAEPKAAAFLAQPGNATPAATNANAARANAKPAMAPNANTATTTNTKTATPPKVSPAPAFARPTPFPATVAAAPKK
ncbi:MAG TPA: flagellar motor protein MotB [Bryobacteraceae bacterium]|nr:flagellar motor protein MotB [Bryobacteraceae bacterium]